MDKFKLLITNCKCELNSLLNRIRGEKITHIIVTNNGHKIKCYESVELFSGETKIIIATCLIRLKKYMITINDDKVDYILEKYNDNTWNQVLNIINIDGVDESVDDCNSIYG